MLLEIKTGTAFMADYTGTEYPVSKYNSSLDKSRRCRYERPKHPAGKKGILLYSLCVCVAVCECVLYNLKPSISFIIRTKLNIRSSFFFLCVFLVCFCLSPNSP